MSVIGGLILYGIASQLVGDEDLGGHIDEMTAIVLQVSPGSLASGSEEELMDRKAQEQRVIAQFNLVCLCVKHRVLTAERDELVEDLEELADEFLALPTRLGSSSADFVRVVDHSMCAGELL